MEKMPLCGGTVWGMMDKNSKIPLYKQLYDAIKEDVVSQKLEEHQPIDGEYALIEKYHVSRTTVRQALGKLVEDGYLYRRQGSGTFVAPVKHQRNLQGLASFSSEMGLVTQKQSSKVILFERIKAPLRVSRALGIRENSMVLRIKRLRYMDSAQPIGIHDSYLNLDSWYPITQDELERRGSLYSLLEEKYDIFMQDADETLEVRNATKEEKNLLNLKKPDIVMFINRVSWTQYKQPIEYCEMIYRGDKYRYLIHLHNEKRSI